MSRIQQDFKGFRRIGTRISARRPNPLLVMPGLVPGIHAAVQRKRWKGMPGTSPGMTEGAHSGTVESEGTGDVARVQNPRSASPDG